MWYGSKPKLAPTLIRRRELLHSNWKIKKDKPCLWTNRGFIHNSSTFTFLPSWKMLILRNSSAGLTAYKFYLYNQTYYFTFATPRAAVVMRPNKSTNTVFFQQSFWDPLYNGYLKALQSAYNSITSIFFSKMKFKGKGYYVYKNARNTIAPQFGYAHRIYVYAFNISVKFLSKTSVLLYGVSKKDILTVGYNFRSKKPINIFTGRGVRFSRQVVYKKTGKVSAYR